MPNLTEADTIRILVATDNHVGYNERDPQRGDDSWRTFDEIMTLAKARDVDMVLLAGDLFHENKPSRNSMYQVLRSLRKNCLGEKPCELEFLGDGSEVFGGAFNHVNYEDPDINVAIPVFSIHGNHDDPSGEGHFAALDLLQVSGLVNYYGRTPESDKIEVKPVLLQKGRTKLALYGMSNVRDERLFRTFRDGKVKFFQPGTQKSDWFNLMSVHQNHHAHTETGYLPESFLPEFLDLVIWGHEHECLIEPTYNPDTSFHVCQPGSSVATSLMPGEAKAKHVGILSITGKDFKMEPIRLKTVRPFLMKDITLAEEPELKNIWKKSNNRSEITRHLASVVEDLITEANQEWLQNQDEEEQERLANGETDQPLPLIRIRVEYTAPDGGSFDCENPQRFSKRFTEKVANDNDIVHFHRKKKTARKAKDAVEQPDASVIAEMALDAVKVEELVREFLTAQSLTILPQNSFGDSVSQFVDKDDKHAMEVFVSESLTSQVKHLLHTEDDEDDTMTGAMEEHRAKLEAQFAAGQSKPTRKGRKFKPRPDHWDSDLDGAWEDDPGALIHTEDDGEDPAQEVSPPTKAVAPRGRGRGAKAAPASTRKTAAATKAAPKGRAKKPVIEEEDDDEESDVNMLLDDDDEDDLFVKAPTNTATSRAAATSSRNARSSQPATKQSKLDFAQPSQSRTRPVSSRAAAQKKQVIEVSDDDISDDDAFEPVLPPTRATRSRR